MFSSSARQQLEYARLFSRISRSLTRVAPRRAIPFPTARSRWFDSRLRVVLRALWAALMGTRAPVGLLHPRLCLSGTAPTSIYPLLLLLPRPDISFSPLAPSPPSCCCTLRISSSIPPHRAAAKNFPGGLFTNHGFSRPLGPSHLRAPEFHEAAGRNRSNQFTISLGTNSRYGRIAPMSHRQQASLSLFPTASL